MPIRTYRGEQLKALAAWAQGLNINPAKGFASGILFTLLVIMAAMPLVLGNFVWAFVALAVGAALFLYNFRK